jgi:hypothetical protein
MMPLSTKLSIGAAALLAAATLPTLTSAQSTCRWSYSSSCKTNPRSATYDVIFEVDEVSSNADIDGYPVTAIFHWGVENTTFIDTYGPGKQIKLSDTYYYDNNGYYTTGFSLIFGDGAAGCAGKTIQDLDTLELGSGCAFGVDTPPPTPVPTTMETPEPTPVPTQNPITMFPTGKPTFEPSPQPSSPPTSPPTIMEPVATTTTTDATTTTTVADTTTTSTEASTTTAMITTTTIAPDTTTTTATTTTSTVPATTSSTTTTKTLSQKQIVPSSMTLYNVGELDSTALNKWRTKTIQQIITHSEDEDITVTLDNVSQVAVGRRFLRQQEEEQQHSRILADDGYLKIDFDALVETESNGGLTEQDADDIVASGFSTAARQTEYIYLLKSADSATFGDIDRMIMVVDGTKVVTPGIDDAQKPDGGDGGGSNMGIIIGAAVGGVLAVFILIGSVFYIKRRKQLEPIKSGSPLKDSKVMRDDVMGKEWSMQNAPESPDEEQTCASPYLGTIESREGEDDVSTLGDPYFGEAIDARDTGTVAESMVSSDMLALGVKRRGVGSSNASRMDATTATGYTTGLGSTYQMTFADDTTLDDAYQTPDAIGYEEEEDEDYERIVVVAPPGKLGIVIDNPSGNIPFVHAIKETSVLHGKVHVGDLVLAVDEVDCRGMHSMSVSRLISKRCDSARTLRLLRNSAC